MSPPPPIPPHAHMDFVVSPPGCGRSVTDFWGWDAHEAQLRCPDDVSVDDMCERGVTGVALNLTFISYPDRGHYGDLLLQEKIPTTEPGIWTRYLMVSSQKLWPPCPFIKCLNYKRIRNKKNLHLGFPDF
jgi:hypothetical protein